jgi:hypothetical protein
MPLLPSLLLVDLLGVKAQWETQGASAARREFRILEDLVKSEMRSAPASVEWAEIESDTACVACSSTNEAIRFGARLYRRAFRAPAVGGRKVWLRGVLVRRPSGLEQGDMRRKTRTPSARTTVNQLADPLLEAIAYEKAGFKGMRLVVHGHLATTKVDRAAILPITDTHAVKLLARLSGGTRAYPSRLKGFVDVLWMGADEVVEQRRLAREMTTRLRTAVRDDQELVHGGATQVLFDEWSKRLRSTRSAG